MKRILKGEKLNKKRVKETCKAKYKIEKGA